VSAAWVTIGVLAAGTALIKASGPVALGGRELPPVFGRIIGLLAPSLIAALVVVQTVTTSSSIVVDARVAGLAAAAGAIALKRTTIEIVLVAAAVTAAVRALT
jgi:branched-subunit amino acid transport protein